MPSSIPYNHPSLVLGNIVDTRVLDFLKQIDACQSKIDSAQDKLNSLIMMKRSISMTMNELADLDLEDADSDIQEKLKSLDASIKNAASGYVSARLENEDQIQKVRSELSDLEAQESLESPLDFSASELKRLPLSAESLKMDSQYFSFGSNMQDDVMANLEKFVRSNTAGMGDKSEEITSAVSSQVSSQIQNHNIAGTLIILASCTHSTVRLFQPLVIDADKAVSAWNNLFPSEKINTGALQSAEVYAENASEADDEKTLSVISGASYGSSFVGMVHILNSDSSGRGDIDKLKQQIDQKLKIGGWLENSSGGFGVDEGTMNEVKAFLSTQLVSSHVSIVTMGAVPSMSSGTLALGLAKLADMDVNVANSIAGEEEVTGTISSESDQAKTRARIFAAQNAKIQSIMKGLGKIDHQNNKVLDINSMMSAFENYLSAIKGNSDNTGVPVNFYLKKLRKPEIEKLWLSRYYPDRVSDNKTDENKTNEK